MDEPDNSPFRVGEDILPIGELKAHLSERIRELRSRPERPLVITQNGRAAAVLLAPEEFDRLTSQTRFVAAVRRGIDDAEAGRVVSHEGMKRRLSARLEALAASKQK